MPATAPAGGPGCNKEYPCQSRKYSYPTTLITAAFCGSCCPASAPCCSPPSTASWMACASRTLWAKRLLPPSTSSCLCRCWSARWASCLAPAAAPSWASRWARATGKRPTAISASSSGQPSSRASSSPLSAFSSSARRRRCWAQRARCWIMPSVMAAS